MEYNPSIFVQELNIDKYKVLELINSLKEKNILTILIKKENKKVSSEYISLQPLYDKIMNIVMDNKEKANAENTMKQIEELGYKGFMYQDQEYVVITDIFIKQKEAHQQAKEIAEKGNTCVVKEYFIDDRYQKKIEKKEYNAIYQFLKTN